MRHFGVFFLLTGATMTLTGCGQMSGPASASSRGGMAVVDLDKVAAETGRDRVLAQSLELAQNSLNQSYAKTVEDAKDKLEKKFKDYGTAPSDAEKTEYSQIERNALNQLSQIQNNARTKFEQYKQVQIAKFRAELKPITQEIATKRGLSIVIPKNEGLLLSIDPGIDITDEVIKVLREKHPVRQTEDIAPAETTAKRRSAPAKSAGTTRTAAAEDDEDEPVR